jgi:hypothetical protein
MGNFIILVIMQYNIQSVLQDTTTLSFSLMTAYLTDLLQKRNAIVADELVPQADCNLREYLQLHVDQREQRPVVARRAVRRAQPQVRRSC